MSRGVKFLRAGAIALVSAMCVALFAVPSACAAGQGLDVTPVFPSEQRSETSTYFDVVADPGKEVTLAVNVANTTSASMKVAVNVVPAQTGDAGTVIYQESIRTPKLLAHNLKSLVSNASETLTVPAGKTVTFTTVVHMPEAAFKGVFAGGIAFEELDQATDQTASDSGVGVGVTSKYRYVIAALARNHTQASAPDLTFGAASVRQRNYKNQIALQLRNKEPAFLNDLALEVSAKLRGGSEKYSRSGSAMQMAPTSAFNYAISLPDDVAVGTYDVTATAYYVANAKGKYKGPDSRKYEYRKTFKSSVVVTKEKAAQFASSIKSIRDSSGLPWWGYVIISLLLLLLILLIIAYIVYRRKKAENQRLRAQLEALPEQSAAPHSGRGAHRV